MTLTGPRNYRVGSIVYLMLNPALAPPDALIWLDATNYHYSNADKLELSSSVADWLALAAMKPRLTYYGDPMCIELAFADDVDAQLFCLAWKVETFR